MEVSENALNIITALTYRGIGRAWVVTRLQRVESASTIVNFLNKDSKEGRVIPNSEFEERKGRVRSQINRLAENLDGVVALGDSGFPPFRGAVKNSEKPVVLFYRGDLSLLDATNNNVAVIGILDPDDYTERVERKIVSGLVRRGATIVSGLALGCDSIAHKQALLSGGKTVAILPSPIDDILPQSNKDLAEDIVRNSGLLISEYYEKAKSRMEMSSRYQDRDRLQALFSDCVVLSASYSKNDLGNDSGSRHAMEYAASYSIPRAVLYNVEVNKENPKYDLNRQLIKEDSKVIIASEEKERESVDKILSMQSNATNLQSAQRDLF